MLSCDTFDCFVCRFFSNSTLDSSRITLLDFSLINVSLLTDITPTMIYDMTGFVGSPEIVLEKSAPGLDLVFCKL